jgi:hypothetical protein
MTCETVRSVGREPPPPGARPSPMTSAHPHSRRRAVAAVVGLVLVLAAVPACGDRVATDASASGSTSAPSTQGSGQGISHPTGADEVVVSIRTAGGFGPWQGAIGTLPTVLVTGDGRVLTPGATTMEYPGPLVAPVEVAEGGEDLVQDLLAEADGAGLLAPPPAYDDPVPLATDLPTTTVLVAASGETREHRAYALGEPGTEQGARRSLAAFVERATAAAAAAGGAQLLEPEALVVRAMPLAGRRVPRDDGPAAAAWPETAGTRLAALAESCGVVDDPATVALLVGSRQDVPFRDGGRTWELGARAALPGDPGC